MPCISQFQLTLAILKPDLVSRPFHLELVRKMILDRNFVVVRSKSLHLNKEMAEEFYAEHEGRFFYNRLITFICSGPSHIHILARENAIKEWRALMGPTKVFRAQYSHPDSIRGRVGLTDTRNASHGSDSEENARKEIHFFFPEFNFDHFFQNDVEKILKSDNLKIDRATFQHRL